MAIVCCPQAPAIYTNSRDLVRIRVVRSRLPRALEFCLQKNFAYQATYFPSHQFDQGKKKKMLRKQKTKAPVVSCEGRGGEGIDMQ